MRSRLALALGFLILVVAACSGGSGSSGAGARDVSEALDPNTEPVTVTTTVDQSRAASALIGPAGGTLTATGADGSRYVLDVPVDALVFETEITMTPIQSMDGLPLENGLAAGVQLEPEGISFFDFVTLTIEPAVAIPVEQQVPIGSSGDAGAVYIPLIDLDPETIRLRLTHFSSAGLSKGLLADLDPVRQRLGGDAEARLSSLFAREMAWARQNNVTNLGLTGAAFLLDEYRKQVLEPRAKAASESCAAAQVALQSASYYDRMRQLMGDDSGDSVGPLIPAYAKVCIQEEYELCRDDHIVHRILPVISHMEQMRYRATGPTPEMDQILAHAQDLAAKCLHFEIEFESTARMESDDTDNESEVEAKVEFSYEPGSMPPSYTGDSALVNTNYEVSDPAGGPCTTTGNRGGGTFEVSGLEFFTGVEDKDDRVGFVKDILLTYSPGISTETITATCPGAGSLTTPPASIWSNIYMAVHSSELGAEEQMRIADEGQPPPIPKLTIEQMQSMMQSGAPPSALSPEEAGPGATYTTKVWQVKGGELFAEKEWDLSVSSGGASMTEEGTFRLYHRPE